MVQKFFGLSINFAIFSKYCVFFENNFKNFVAKSCYFVKEIFDNFWNVISPVSICHRFVYLLSVLSIFHFSLSLSFVCLHLFCLSICPFLHFYIDSLFLTACIPSFSDANICHKCWTFMKIAIKIIDRALRGKKIITIIVFFIYCA